MAGIIAGALSRLKEDVQRFLGASFVAQVALELGLAWRNTPLAVPQLVALFARQILGGNLSMPELARLAGSTFTPEAYAPRVARDDRRARDQTHGDPGDGAEAGHRAGDHAAG